MHFDDSLRYGQPQAGSAFLPGDGVVGLLDGSLKREVNHAGTEATISCRADSSPFCARLINSTSRSGVSRSRLIGLGAARYAGGGSVSVRTGRSRFEFFCEILSCAIAAATIGIGRERE
jgi:hypothetical protein